MKRSCTIMPKKGGDTFRLLKKNLGYLTAAKVWNKISTDTFINDFKDSLTLNSEGVPTYDSLMKLPIVKNYIGDTIILLALNKNQKVLPDTIENVGVLVYEADRINKEDQDHIAIVDYTDNNDLTIKILPKNELSITIAKNQLAIQKLNTVVANILGKAGVTIEHMSSIEVATGKVGEVNFNHAKSIANEFTGLLRIADNLEGVTALSEEFSHLLVRIYKDSPIILRSINYLKNEDIAKLVLGEKYELYYEEYNGDIDRIAEEAVGHILRELFLEYNPTNKAPLFSRAKSFIINLFKGINPSFYLDSIDLVKNDISLFAQDIIRRKTPITRELILLSKKDIKFNALSEKGKLQLKVLRKISERIHRESGFILNVGENGTERRDKKRVAQNATALTNTAVIKEETMLALAELIDVSLKEVKDSFSKLSNLDNMGLLDKFKTLRNALYTIQSNGSTIEELYSVLSLDFLDDPAILLLHFMLLDENNILSEYRTTEPVTLIDTSNMSVDEIANIIVRNSQNIKLSEDGKYYINVLTGEKYLRATQVIQAYVEGHTFDESSPFVRPSTNIGTGIDELIRDYISGRILYNTSTLRYTVEGLTLDKVYPNATEEQMTKFLNLLYKTIKDINDKGITLISRDVIVDGTVDTTDDNGHIHTVRVAGTLDLLGYDSGGNWYIYDMKTHRGHMDLDTKDKYARLVSLYKKLLEDKYGIKIKNLSIIPIKVNYPAPSGTLYGTALYTVNPNKPDKYNGKESNQLIKDGEEFRGANPFLEDIIEMEELVPNVDYRKLTGDYTGGLGDPRSTILTALGTLTSLYKMLEDRFYKESLEAFVSFLIPFMGETMEISDGKGGLKTVTLKEIVENSGKDITMMLRYFTSMADNPDGLLLAFDKVVKVQKNIQRLNTIDMSLKIIALGIEYEKKGITNYDWMFEEGNKRYINKLIIDGKDYSYDRSAYDKAYNEYLKTLNDTYGKNPLIGSLEYKRKKELRILWIKDNTERVTIEGLRKLIPDPTKYPSLYSSLDSTKRDFYNKWMLLKEELDSILPNGATTVTNTIKIRKSAIERVGSLLKHGDINGLIKEAKSSFMKSYDDSYNYTGLVGLNNEEVLTLPVYYIHAKDTEDLTHDVIGSLVAYADMAYNYLAMKDIVNPLEIGRNWVMNKRTIHKTKGNRKLSLTNKSNTNKFTTEGIIDPKKSKMGALLNDFFESKIYERYLEDAGEVGGVDINKTVSKLLKLGSTILLGLNGFALAANVLTGISMLNIEAAAGLFFDAKELKDADLAFMSELGYYIGDIGQRVKYSKLALFDELFNIKLDFRSKLKKVDFLNRTILGRIFGPRLLFFGLDAGDFWLYNRTAISMAMRKKLLDKNNNEISLWDALITIPIDKDHPEYGNKLVLQDGVTNLDGTSFSRSDIGDFERKVGHVNRHLFGIYNTEDALAAKRTVWGRFILLYRDWIPSLFRYRFGVLTTNPDTGDKFEGYYRTSIRFLWGIKQELLTGLKTLLECYNELSDFEKANIKRAVFELNLVLCVNILCYILGTRAKDKDRSWVEIALRALALRERTELGALSLGIQMPKEIINIIKSPVAATSIIQDMVDLFNILNPVAWSEEIESGDFKGHSKAYRSFVRSPLTLWYRNIKKTMNPAVIERYYEGLAY